MPQTSFLTIGKWLRHFRIQRSTTTIITPQNHLTPWHHSKKNSCKTQLKTHASLNTSKPTFPQEKITEDELYYFLDLIVDYYAESGVLDATPDKDGFVEIDTEAIANHLSAKAAKEGVGKFSPEDLLFVVQAELDYGLEQEEN